MKRLVIFGVFLILFTNIAYAVPPTEEVRARLELNGDWARVVETMCEARRNGIDAPGSNPLDQLRAHRRDDADAITLQIPVILVDFPDQQANQEQFSAAHFRELLFELNGSSMRDYYLENSYGEVDVVGEVFGWFRMEETYAHYVGDNYGLSGGGGELARAACAAADGDADFSRYDNDGDGVVEAAIIVHAGAGAEASGSESDIWSHAGYLRSRLDSVNFHRYSMNPENGRMGVFGHEIGHALFGLPDLYDYDYSSNGLGVWSMMAYGSWAGPSHLDAWCKYKLGFIHPLSIDRDHQELSISPIQAEDQCYQLPIPRLGQPEYFLVENRQKTGFDRDLPAAGLLIYHIDMNVGGVWGANNKEWYPGSGSDHYLVALEQADGNWDIEHRRNYGDAGDPFPGQTQTRDFLDQTSPNSRGYQNNRSRTWITEIRTEENNILCNILNGVNAQNLMVDSVRVSPERVNPGRQVTFSYRFGNDGNINSNQTVIRTVLSRDAAYSGDDVILGNDQVENRLAAGESVHREVQLSIPQNTQLGGYYILAIADPDLQQLEITKDDNLAAGRLLVGMGANLHLRQFTVSPAFIRPGQRFDIDYQISNNGGEATEDFTLEFYFSRDSLRSNDDISLGSREDEDGLAEAGEVERSVQRMLPIHVTAGYCYILAILDRQNHIREIDETDNILSAKFTIPGPNLQVIYAMATPTELRPAMETDVQIWLSNTGIVDAGISSVGIALSHDSTLSNDDWTLGELQVIDSLALGDTLQTTCRRAMSADVWTGNWFILIKCDCIGRIAEMNEDDNIYTIPITVTSEGVAEENRDQIPSRICMYAPYPNPTNGDVSLEFTLPQRMYARVTLINIHGAIVATPIVSEYMNGKNQFVYNMADLPTGLYFVVLEAGGCIYSKRLVLIR